MRNLYGNVDRVKLWSGIQVRNEHACVRHFDYE